MSTRSTSGLSGSPGLARVLLEPPLLATLPVAAGLAHGIYRKPDVIAIPGLFELLYVPLAYVACMLVHTTVVAPGAFLVRMCSVSWIAGAAYSLALAGAGSYLALLGGLGPSLPDLLDVDLVLLVAAPLAVLAGRCFALLRQRSVAGSPLTADWKRRLGIGMAVVVLVAVGICRRWTSPPTPPTLSDRGPASPGGLATPRMLSALAGTLTSKPGGLLCDESGLPGPWVGPMRAWERGALREIARFVPVVDAGFRSGPRRALDEAVAILGRGERLCDERNADALLEQARLALERHLASVPPPTPDGAPAFSPFPGFRRWLEYPLRDVSGALLDQSERIAAALHYRVAPGEHLLIVRNLLPLDEGVQEARGGVWVIRAVLTTLDPDVAPALERSGALEPYRRARSELDAFALRSLPGTWLLTRERYRDLGIELSAAEARLQGAGETFADVRRQLYGR